MTFTDLTNIINGTAPELDALAKLRQPFTGDAVGKLPRVTCRQCSQSQGRVCDKHSKRQCDICGNFMTTAHIHLDYVGHAEVTDRLLEADPYWEWDFLSRDIDPAALAAIASAEQSIQAGLLEVVIDNSPPHFERDRDGNPIGLWITLTVDNVTRKGFGSVESAKFEAEKQLIGDALRNAAMRFGVALALWSKGQLESESADDFRPAPDRAQPGAPPNTADAPPIGNGEAPPLWREFGYQDPDEMQALNDSLADILHAVGSDQKASLRVWLIDNGYTMPDPQGGAPLARPLPVRKHHVDEYRALLIAARTATSTASVEPGMSHAERDELPEAHQPALSAPGAPEGGDDGQSPTEPDSDGVPSRVVDDIAARVKLLTVDQIKEELRDRHLPVAGNKDTIGARLSMVFVDEWRAEQVP